MPSAQSRTASSSRFRPTCERPSPVRPKSPDSHMQPPSLSDERQGLVNHTEGEECGLGGSFRRVSDLMDPVVSARIQHALSEMDDGFRPGSQPAPSALRTHAEKAVVRSRGCHREPTQQQVHLRYIFTLTCQYLDDHDTRPGVRGADGPHTPGECPNPRGLAPVAPTRPRHGPYGRNQRQRQRSLHTASVSHDDLRGNGHLSVNEVVGFDVGDGRVIRLPHGLQHVAAEDCGGCAANASAASVGVVP